MSSCGHWTCAHDASAKVKKTATCASEWGRQFPAFLWPPSAAYFFVCALCGLSIFRPSLAQSFLYRHLPWCRPFARIAYGSPLPEAHEPSLAIEYCAFQRLTLFSPVAEVLRVRCHERAAVPETVVMVPSFYATRSFMERSRVSFLEYVCGSGGLSWEPCLTASLF